MLKRDFSASNKEYFKKNKFVLIGVALFVLLGIIIMSVFGFNGNFEFTGYYEIEVNVGHGSTSGFASKIGDIIDSYGGDYEGYQVSSRGDNTTIIVRYLNKLSNATQLEINEQIIDLSTDLVTISIVMQDGDTTGHVKIGGTITTKDYVYTILTILLLIIFATIFCYARYNPASGITVMLSMIASSIILICLTAILRLTIGQSYFAMLAILNLLVAYACIGLFENIRETSWLQANEYSQALDHGIKHSKFRLCFISIAVFVVGLLFAFIAPSSIKYIALNILFIAVTLLAVMLYVVPFVWSVFITNHNRIKPQPASANKAEVSNKTEVETKSDNKTAPKQINIKQTDTKEENDSNTTSQEIKTEKTKQNKTKKQSKK